MTRANAVDLAAPFPWFGGKRAVAAEVWESLGNPDVYVEPFAGSLAVLLARPHAPRIEVANDLDGWLCNFWRAVAWAPELVARHMEWPLSALDLRARHRWICEHRAEFTERLARDPLFFDAMAAGWWAWGVSCANGANFLRGTPSNAAPRNSAHSDGCGTMRQGFDAPAVCAMLSKRLRGVRMLCGEWDACLTFAQLHGDRAAPALAGIFLDPPYDPSERVAGCYGANDARSAGLSAKVRAWCIEHGDDPRKRIVLAGYEEEHAMPETWRSVEREAHGGWSGWGGKGTRGKRNKKRERLWLSPHCVTSGPLFDHNGTTQPARPTEPTQPAREGTTTP